MKHVCFFRHALALDERRVKFLPEYAYGGSATCAKPDDENPSGVDHGSSERGNKPSTKNEGETTKDISPSNKVHPQTLEVWFAGTHSDMWVYLPVHWRVRICHVFTFRGGGNVQNSGMDRSGPPLRWMALEARALGLRTKPLERELFLHDIGKNGKWKL